LEQEHEYQKGDLLDTVREQEREISFCHEVMKQMFKTHELGKIRGRSKYDDNRNKWIVPLFYIKEKEVLLPKIRQA